MLVKIKCRSALYWCVVVWVLSLGCQRVQAQSWSATGSLQLPLGLQSMSTARDNHTATLLNNGKVLVVGGQDGTGNGSVSSCQLYDPATGTWSNTGSLNYGRSFHTATLLNDGRVLVAGGSYGSGNFYPAACEIYNPSTGAWTFTGSLTTARYLHTATLLSDGKVLVVSGSDGTTTIASCELFNPATGTWTVTGALTTGRTNHTATLLNTGKVLVVGGSNSSGSALNTFQVYDPSTGTWSNAATLAAARRNHTATLLSNGKVLVAGGRVPSASSITCQLYDPSAGTWSNTGNMAGARYNHTATVLSDGKVLVMAGQLDGLTYLNTCEVFNPSTGIWSANGNLNIARSFHTATLLNNGKILAAGGRNYGGGTLNSCELYDPATGTSVQSSPRPERYEHTATLLGNGKVLVAGGTDYNNAIIQRNCQLYDPATGTWSNTGNMATAQYGHAAVLLGNGKVLVMGAGTCELYDPATGTWSNTGSMNSIRRYHAAVRLNDGKVLLLGGQGGASILSTCELYDPATGTWTATGSMANARYRPTAILLNDGKVLVVGAYNGSGFLNSCELYDPATGSWSNTGSMISARAGATATLLSNGKILAVGGSPNNSNSLSSCELYDPTAGTWSITGSMSTGRYHHTANSLSNGKVLITGGIDNTTTYLSSCEVYDPTAGTWSTTASMSVPRENHTTTLLNNGLVLAAGGYNGSAVLSSAELYGHGPVPSISISDVSANEGNNGTMNIVFTVTLSSVTSQTVTVNYASANGTATAGSDYSAVSGALTIAAGQSSGTTSVPVNGDVTVEADETFLLNLSGAINATIADSQGTGTIVNDDANMDPSSQVTITNPLHWSTHAAGALTQATGTATDGDGIASVSLALYRYASNGNSAGFWNGTSYDATYSAAVHDRPASSTDGFATWSMTLPVLRAGQYYLSASVRDVLGNSSNRQKTHVFTINDSTPQVTITNPLHGTTHAASTLTQATGTAHDSDGIASVSLALYRYASNGNSAGFWNGTSFDATYSAAAHERPASSTNDFATWNTALPSLVPGLYYVSASVRDSVGNWSNRQKTHVFTINDSTPQVTITNPLHLSTHTASALTQATGTAHDSDGIASVSLALYRYASNGNSAGFWNGTSFDAAYNAAAHERPASSTNDFATWNMALPSLVPGLYYVSASVRDSVGNWSNRQKTHVFYVTASSAALSATQPRVEPATQVYASALTSLSTISLKFTGTAPSGAFTVLVNGIEVKVQSVERQASTVTLLLPDGSLQAGDEVAVRWNSGSTTLIVE